MSDKAKPGAASAAPGYKNTASVAHTALVTWLRDQVDIDEDDANACLANDLTPGPGREWAEQILREVAAKRKLIRRYELACAGSTPLVSYTRGQDDGYRQACLDAIRDAAEVYAGQPGYREEWAEEEFVSQQYVGQLDPPAEEPA